MTDSSLIVSRANRLSLNEVAGALGIHVATVWRWVLRGVRGRKLPSVMIGGRRYVARKALATFLDAQNVPSDKISDDFHQRAQNAGRLLDAKGATSTVARWKAEANKTDLSVAAD